MSSGQPINIAIDEIDIDTSMRNGERHGSLRALTASIEKEGVVSPIEVSASERGRWTLVRGHRRVRAARTADLREIPCIIVESAQGWESQCRNMLLQQGLRDIDMINNVMRLCSAHGGRDQEELITEWRKLAGDDAKPDQEPKGDASERAILNRVLAEVGIWPTDSFLQMFQRIFKLPLELRTLLQVGEIDSEQAIALSKIKDSDERTRLTNLAAQGKITAMEISREAKRIREKEKAQEGKNNGESGASEELDDEELQRIKAEIQEQIEGLPGKTRSEANKHLRALFGILSRG